MELVAGGSIWGELWVYLTQCEQLHQQIFLVVMKILSEVEIGKADLHTVRLCHHFIFIIIIKNKKQMSRNRFIKINSQISRASKAVQMTQMYITL